MRGCVVGFILVEVMLVIVLLVGGLVLVFVSVCLVMVVS